MRFLSVLFCVGLGVLAVVSRASDTASRPTLPKAKTEAEWEVALKPYVERAQREMPAILERYERTKDAENPSMLALVTRRTGADGKPFEIMMKFEKATSSGVLMGIVMGKHQEDSPVKEGDEIGIVASEIYDWGFREGLKTVEGFIVKRARNAILVGTALVVFDLQSDAKGRLIHVELDSAVLPLTQDDVTDILPASVAPDGKAYLVEYYKQNKVPERFAQVTLFYTFPGGLRLADPDPDMQSRS